MTGLQQVLEHLVTADDVDEAGHLNIRRYADLAELCVSTWTGNQQIDEVFTRHLREQPLGAHLRALVGFVDADEGGARCHVELRNQDDVVAAASLVRIGWRTRPSTDLVGRARATLVEWPEIGRPRTLVLGPLPSIDPAIASGRTFEVWSERTVVVEECDADGHFAGGPSPLSRGPHDGTIGVSQARGQFPTRWLFTSPDGHRLAFVNAESRRVVFERPRAGARIRAIDADIGFGHNHRLRREWTVDLDTGVTYASGDFVDLMLDLDARRVVAVPDSVRAEIAAHFHPDLAGFDTSPRP